MNADAGTDKHRLVFREQRRNIVACLSFICRSLSRRAGIVFFCSVLTTVAWAQPTHPSTASKSSPAGTSPATGDRTVVAHVNDKPIYKADVDQLMAMLTKGQQVPASQLPETQAAVLEMLIGQRLYTDFIDRHDNLKPKPEEVEKQVEDIRTKLREKRISLEQFARQKGLTLAGFNNQVASDLSRFKFLQEYSTPERVAAYFKRNARHFDGTQLRVSHILLRPKGNGNEAEVKELRAKAEQVKAEIESGKLSFADAAKRHSAGPSRQEGGDLGFIGRKGPMVEEFSKAAFDLEQGKISAPVISTFGIHLITVTEVKPGDKTLELVRDDVMPVFEQWLHTQLIDAEKKTAKIEFNVSFPHFKPGTRELASAEK